MPSGLLQGLCPRCLGAFQLAAPTDGTARGDDTSFPTPPPDPTDIARHFPQLDIIRCLGRGGMGVVYEAHQKSLDRRVALKILAPERKKDASFTERFLREARALARLNHPHIVTVHDFGESDGLHFLLMEYVDGMNLRQLLASKTLTPEAAMAIVPPLCEALQYAHEQGIVHRDVKPENLLLDRHGRIKIADFGIARLMGDPAPSDTATSEHAVGTPHYMAPEQRERPQTVDHRADIYSLGVVFYEMLTGELPAGPLLPPSRRVQVDVRLDEIVLRALEREPDRRYQTAGEFRSQVETVAATPATPASTRPSPGISAIPTPKLNARSWARLSLGFLIAGTLGTLVLMTLSHRHELALVFGGLALVLALITGIKSRPDRLGTTVTFSVLGIFLMAGLTTAVLTEWLPLPGSRRHAARQAALDAAARERMKLLALTQQTSTAQVPDSASPSAGGTSTPSDAATSILVSADGSGDYPTLQAALDAAPPHAHIRVGPGRFPERLILRKPVHLEGAGWDQSIIGPERVFTPTPSAPNPPPATVQIFEATPVTLQHLRFTEPGMPEEGRLSPHSVLNIAQAQVTMTHCAVVGGPGRGIHLGDGADMVLQHSLIAAVWNTGVVIGNGARGALIDSDIRNCYYAGVTIQSQAIHPRILRCRISGAAWHGIRYDHASPIVISNLVFANARSGIYASGRTQARVEANVFFDNEMNGMSCWYDNHDRISGNTFIANHREALSILGASSPTLQNNIFHSHPVALYQGFIQSRDASTQALGSPEVRHNLFWNNATNWVRWPIPSVQPPASPDQVNLNETNTSSMDPGLRDPEHQDFSLLPTGAAAQTGTGALQPIPPVSPWPLQAAESDMIPDGPSRDSRHWKRNSQGSNTRTR